MAANELEPAEQDECEPDFCAMDFQSQLHRGRRELDAARQGPHGLRGSVNDAGWKPVNGPAA